MVDEPLMSREDRDQLRNRRTAGVKERERHGRGWLAAPRVLIPVAAAVLTGALAGGVAIFSNLPDSPPPADSTSSILDRVATELEAQDSAAVQVPEPEQWVYLHLTTVDEYFGPGEEETWTRVDNSLQSRREADGTITTTDGEGLGIGKPIAGAFDTPAETHGFLANLPVDDPAATLEQIYQLVNGSRMQIMTTCDFSKERRCQNVDNIPWAREGSAFLMIDLLLQQTNPPAETQAILFRALNEIPTVEDAGKMTDITGKEVVAVRWDPPAAFKASATLRVPTDNFVLIDPETNLYRGRLELNDESQRDDKCSNSQIVTGFGIVDETGQVP